MSTTASVKGTIKFDRESKGWVAAASIAPWAPDQFSGDTLAEVVGKIVWKALDDNDGHPVGIELMIDADNGKPVRKLTIANASITR